MTMKQETLHTLTPKSNSISVEEVNRILEVGKLLLTVLTPEELVSLQQLIDPGSQPFCEIDKSPVIEIGNMSVT